MFKLLPDDNEMQVMLKSLINTGFTEEALAHGLFISQSTVSRIIHGKSLPRINVASKIMQIYEKYQGVPEMN
jgi:predicted transcriptional regulator